MPQTIRLTSNEQELIRKKSIEINKQLVAAGMPPMRESELLHKILEESITNVYLEKGILKIR